MFLKIENKKVIKETWNIIYSELRDPNENSFAKELTGKEKIEYIRCEPIDGLIVYNYIEKLKKSKKITTNNLENTLHKVYNEVHFQGFKSKIIKKEKK